VASSVEAGKGYVRIFSDLAPFDKGIKQVESRIKAIGSSINQIEGNLRAVGNKAASAISSSVKKLEAAGEKSTRAIASSIKQLESIGAKSAKAVASRGSGGGTNRRTGGGRDGGGGRVGVGSGLGVGGSAAVIGAGSSAVGAGLFAGLAVPSTYASSIETAQTAFEILTGSATKASQVINALRTKAANTPLEFAGIAQATQTLLAFGIGADDAVKAMDFLGDVSLGNQEKLDRLSLAFGQVAAKGRLMGQEVLQFTENGFNPLQEIARVTGRQVKDLTKDMENGAISFDMVKMAFQTATGPGGRFFNALNKQARTTTGAITKFRDSVMIALEPIGTALNKVAKVFAMIGSYAADAIAPVIAKYKSVGVIVAGVAASLLVGGTILAGVGASLIAIGTVVLSIGAIAGGLAAAFGLVASTLSAAVSPAGLIAISVGSIAVYAVNASGAISNLTTLFGDLGKTAVTAWTGIVSSIRSGDIEQAASIAFAGVNVAFESTAFEIKKTWSEVGIFIATVQANAAGQIVKIWALSMANIATIFDSVGSGIAGAFISNFHAAIGIVDFALTSVYVGFDNLFSYIIELSQAALTIFSTLAQAISTPFDSQHAADEIEKMFMYEKRAKRRRMEDLAGRNDEAKKGLLSRQSERVNAFNADKLVISGGVKERADQRLKDAMELVNESNKILLEGIPRAETAGLEAAKKRLDELKAGLQAKTNAALAAEQQKPTLPLLAATTPSRREQAAFERQLDIDQKIENRQARIDTKAYQQAERFKKNHPEQYKRMQAAQTAQQAANSMITSASGGSVGTFVSGVAGSIVGSGVSESKEDQQINLLSSIDGRLREALTGEDGV